MTSMARRFIKAVPKMPARMRGIRRGTCLIMPHGTKVKARAAVDYDLLKKRWYVPVEAADANGKFFAYSFRRCRS